MASVGFARRIADTAFLRLTFRRARYFGTFVDAFRRSGGLEAKGAVP